MIIVDLISIPVIIEIIFIDVSVITASLILMIILAWIIGISGNILCAEIDASLAGSNDLTVLRRLCIIIVVRILQPVVYGILLAVEQPGSRICNGIPGRREHIACDKKPLCHIYRIIRVYPSLESGAICGSIIVK